MSIDQKVLREAQLIMLDMLVDFKAICSKHNLTYWLDSGTLLGAVRHKGFIPWDDDIDISMPLEDYIKFQNIAQDELSKDIFLQSKEIEKSFPFDYLKLRSKKATIVEFHEKGKEVDYHQGIFVDIFPMLTMKKSNFNGWYYKNLFKLIRFFSEKNLHVQTSIPNHNIRKFLIERVEALHQNWTSEELSVIYSGKMPDVPSIFNLNELYPLKNTYFEGHQFSVPKDSKKYLNAIYSFDFMELPPIEKRVIHAHKIDIIY